MPAIGLLPVGSRQLVINDRVAVTDESLEWISSPLFTRPTDTTAYAAGDLVANSNTAASVVALAFANINRLAGDGGYIYGWRLVKSNLTNTNGIFRLHLMSAVPTFATNGDNELVSGNTTLVGEHLAVLDIVAADWQSFVGGGSVAEGQPRSAQGGRIPFNAPNRTIWGVIAAGAAYTPANAETFQSWLLVGKK